MSLLLQTYGHICLMIKENKSLQLFSREMNVSQECSHRPICKMRKRHV